MSVTSHLCGVAIVAAGTSSRMGGVDKVALDLAGKPVIAWSLDACERCPAVDRVVVVTRPEKHAWITDLALTYGWQKLQAVVRGGESRQDSVLAGVQALEGCTWVAVHDAARPFATPELFAQALAKARATNACAIAAAPMRDTVKRLENGVVTATVQRTHLWTAQTPQACSRDLLIAAFAAAHENAYVATDEAMLCEHFGIPVSVVENDAPNFKLTSTGDLQLARALAQQLQAEAALERVPATATTPAAASSVAARAPWRIGIGYDVHRLVPGRSLVLGGVPFPGEVGLEGHSDADVLLHAVMDALLGAAALGDIGKHFPNSDPRYRGADSRYLLRTVRQILAGHGFEPVNVDVMLVAERPKIGSAVASMRANMAADLQLAVDCISVKATTNEGLGPEGRLEGISANAVALVAQRA